MPAKAIEYMIVDALLIADPHLKISERIHDPKRYVYLTDDILNEVERSECPVSISVVNLSQYILNQSSLGT